MQVPVMVMVMGLGGRAFITVTETGFQRGIGLAWDGDRERAITLGAMGEGLG
jgi:hypothetical protein